MIDTEGPGTVLLHDGHVYYSNGFNRGGTLYRFPYDNEEDKQVLAKESAVSLNIEGEWLYYVVPNGMGSFGAANPIRRIKLDGSQQQTVARDLQIEEMVVDGEWIYYTSYDYSDWKVSLNRVKADGTGRQLLYEGYEDFAEVAEERKGVPADIQVEGDSVYLLIKKACGYSKACSLIYHMNKDGSGLKPVHESEYAVSIQLAEGKLYYARFPEQLRDDSLDSVPINLYTMTLDGKQPSLIPGPFEDNSLYFIKTFRVHGDWIYFVAWDRIHKMRTDGKQSSQLADSFGVQGLDPVGEWIYYQSSTNANRVDIDGSRQEVVLY